MEIQIAKEPGTIICSIFEKCPFEVMNCQKCIGYEKYKTIDEGIDRFIKQEREGVSFMDWLGIHKDKYLKNLKKEKEYLLTLPTNEWINVAFYWAETPQGHDFWSMFNQKIQKTEIISWD